MLHIAKLSKATVSYTGLGSNEIYVTQYVFKIENMTVCHYNYI